MFLIDSHCHLNMDYFKDDYREVAQRAYNSGVKSFIMIGTNYLDSQRGVKIANEIPYAFTSIGWHPHDVKDIGDSSNLFKIMKLAENKKVVGYGEIGLDFFKNYSPKDIQIKFFRHQIAVAKELNLPIIIHDRDANEEVTKILKEESAFKVGGVIHCFSGDLDYAHKVMDMNFYISFPGTITFKKNRELVSKLIKSIPIERIIVETDSPFLTPEPHRGKRNEPAFVKYVAEKIAEIKGITFEEVAKWTTHNCIELFRLNIEK